MLGYAFGTPTVNVPQPNLRTIDEELSSSRIPLQQLFSSNFPDHYLPSALPVRREANLQIN